MAKVKKKPLGHAVVSGVSGWISKEAIKKHKAKQKKKLDELDRALGVVLDDFSGKIVTPAMCALACHLSSARSLLKTEREQLLKY